MGDAIRNWIPRGPPNRELEISLARTGAQLSVLMIAEGSRG